MPRGTIIIKARKQRLIMREAICIPEIEGKRQPRRGTDGTEMELFPLIREISKLRIDFIAQKYDNFT